MLNNIAALIGGATAAVGDYESIATVTLTTGTSAIDFTSIPSTYKHLQIRGILLNAASTDNLSIRVGAGSIDTGSNYSSHQLQGTGATTVANASSTSTSAGLSGLVVAGSSYPFSCIFDILDYSNTNKYKTFRGLSGQDGNGTGLATDWRVQLTSGLWQNTSAINAIRVYTPAGNIGNYSTLALYGIK